MRQNKYEYDAFISHAVEDKIPIANELCAKLEAAGLKIWYSGKELGIGDSIEKTIEKGLNRSRYGIVVFSPTYLAKNWTIREFYTLLAKEIEEQKVILPVLYNITLDELKNKDLVMADRFAVNADKGIDFVVERLVREIKRTNTINSVRRPWLSKIRFILLLSLLANVGFLSKATLFRNDPFQQGPLQKMQPIDYRQQYPRDAQALLGEVQDFFSHMNNCACSGDERKTVVGNAADDDITGNHYGTRGEINLSSGAARKMTLAVVFQLETGGAGSAERQSEGNQHFNTLSLSEEEPPFINVANRDGAVSNKKSGCVHNAYQME